MNSYTKGQVDLIDHIKTKVMSIVDDENLAFDILHLLKSLKPIIKDEKNSLTAEEFLETEEVEGMLRNVYIPLPLKEKVKKIMDMYLEAKK